MEEGRDGTREVRIDGIKVENGREKHLELRNEKRRRRMRE